MKRILIATDFSRAAHHASLYGIQLAKALHADVILFNACQPLPVSAVDTSLSETMEDMRKLAEEELDREFHVLLNYSPINIRTFSKLGAPVHAILEAAREQEVDLIIAGTKGTGLRKIFGSTVTALARKTTVPLLLVPDGFSFAPFSKVAMAYERDIQSDWSESMRDIITALVKKFNANFVLVKVAANERMEAFDMLDRPFHLSRSLRHLNPGYDHLHGRNVTETLNEFVHRHHIDLLVVLPHKHTFLESLLVKSTTRSLAFAANIPVLVLPDSA